MAALTKRKHKLQAWAEFLLVFGFRDDLQLANSLLAFKPRQLHHAMLK